MVQTRILKNIGSFLFRLFLVTVAIIVIVAALILNIKNFPPSVPLIVDKNIYIDPAFQGITIYNYNHQDKYFQISGYEDHVKYKNQKQENLLSQRNADNIGNSLIKSSFGSPGNSNLNLFTWAQEKYAQVFKNQIKWQGESQNGLSISYKITKNNNDITIYREDKNFPNPIGVFSESLLYPDNSIVFSDDNTVYTSLSETNSKVLSHICPKCNQNIITNEVIQLSKSIKYLYIFSPDTNMLVVIYPSDDETAIDSTINLRYRTISINKKASEEKDFHSEQKISVFQYVDKIDPGTRKIQ